MPRNIILPYIFYKELYKYLIKSLDILYIMYL